MSTGQQGGRLDLGRPFQLGDRWGYLFDTLDQISHTFPRNGEPARIYPNLVAGKYFVEERDIPADVRPWRPFEVSMAYAPDGSPDPVVVKGGETFYANSHYLVFHRVMESDDPEVPNGVHLSMRTVENDIRHDWREMQRVKNELVGPEWEAVELYPAESRVVDTANQFHLWCFPFRLGFGFGAGIVDDTLTETLGGKQRPLERKP